MNSPNIDRIIDSDYEAYTDRLYEQAYGDNGERCKNCTHFCGAWSGDPHNYCCTDEDDEDKADEPLPFTDPDDCCDDWEWNTSLDEPEDEY